MNKNIQLNHTEEFNKIEKISKEMRNKKVNSRSYLILKNRIKKIYDGINRYRQNRYKEKSLEYLNKIKENKI